MAHTENWNATYESEPADSDSPAGGDDEFRDLKRNVRERMLFEHQWKDSITTDGHHKEGSARSYYTNTAPTTRPDGATALDNSDMGRMWWDINDTNALYHWDGSTWCDDVKIAGNLAITGSVDFAGTVTGPVTITSNVDITGSLDVAGTLTVSGVVDFDSNVQVAGTLSAAGSLDVAEGISVSTGEKITGRHYTNNLAGDNVSENDIFDALKSYIPNNGDKMTVHGSYTIHDSIVLISYAERISATMLKLYYVRIDTNTNSGSRSSWEVTDGDEATTVEHLSIAW